MRAQVGFQGVGIFERLSVAIWEGTGRRVNLPVMRLKCGPSPKVQWGLLAQGVLHATGGVETGVAVLLMRFQMGLQLLTSCEGLFASLSVALKRFSPRCRMGCSNVGSELGMLLKSVLAALLCALVRFLSSVHVFVNFQLLLRPKPLLTTFLGRTDERAFFL